MGSVPISSLYLPGAAIYQSRAAASATFPNLPAYDPSQPPKYWVVPPDPTADPDGPYTIHNLHDANGSATWGVSYITNQQAAALNIPPDSSGTNPTVYPASVPIPMTYPLPAGDSVVDSPFGLIISSSGPAPVAGSPAPAGTDLTIARILANSQQAVALLKGTPA